MSETNHLDFALADTTGGALKEALVYYSKAIDYGRLYLKSHDVQWEQLLKQGAAVKVTKILENNFSDSDKRAVFYLAASLRFTY